MTMTPEGVQFVRDQLERSLDRWQERRRNAQSDADELRAEREVERLRQELARLT